MKHRPVAQSLARGVAWGLLAYIVGSLVVARTSSGWIGLVIGAGGLLAAVVLIPRLGERWPLLRGRLLWTPPALAGLAVLVASVRNTLLGNAPVRWIALFLAAAAVVVALVGLQRSRGRSSPRRWWALVIVTTIVVVAVAVDGFGAYRSREVSAANGQVSLSGTLLVPRGEGPFPAVLFVHGSGPELGLVYRHAADRLAREGIAALIWDKRGSGESVGGSPRDDYAELAEDVAAWVASLRNRPEIDRGRIGLWGWSEGGWVAPLAAARLGDISALVLSSPGIEFGETFYYELGWRLRKAGFPRAEVERAIELRRSINDHYRTGTGRSSLLAELHTAQGEAWYQAAVGVGLLPTPDDVTEPGTRETREWLDRQDFTLLDALAEFEGPVLAAFGLQDRCNPAEAAANTLEAALTEWGNDYLILRYPEAGHGMAVWLTGERSCPSLGIPPLSYPAGFVDETVSWLAQQLK